LASNPKKHYHENVSKSNLSLHNCIHKEIIGYIKLLMSMHATSNLGIDINVLTVRKGLYVGLILSFLKEERLVSFHSKQEIQYIRIRNKNLVTRKIMSDLINLPPNKTNHDVWTNMKQLSAFR